MMYHPRLLFFLRKVSNPRLVLFLWKVSNPRSMFFLWKVSNPLLMFFLWKVSNPGHGTKNCKRMRLVHSLVSATVHWVYLQIFLSQVLQELILVTAPKLQEDEIARGVPLSVYMNLDLYSGFWCTSHCVVF